MTTTAESAQTAGYSDDAPTVVRHLEITGMTCASCVGRIEKSLNKVDGVAGTQVNLATDVATVTYDPKTVALDELNRIKRKWQVALAAALVLMGLMYWPIHIDAMDWLMPAILVIATGTQYW